MKKRKIKFVVIIITFLSILGSIDFSEMPGLLKKTSIQIEKVENKL